MDQLILHLFGDYVLQTNWMANNKIKAWLPAAVHAVVYTLPFIFWFDQASMLAIQAIGITHYLIDRYRLAVYLMFFKNWLTEPSLRWEDCRTNGGYPPATPVWLAGWLTIIADNTIHLAVNYSALRWL